MITAPAPAQPSAARSRTPWAFLDHCPPTLKGPLLHLLYVWTQHSVNTATEAITRLHSRLGRHLASGDVAEERRADLLALTAALDSRRHHAIRLAAALGRAEEVAA